MIDLNSIRRDRRGNIALMSALVMPILLGALGGGVDYARYFALKQELQNAADKAALAGARQFVIANREARVPQNVARRVADDAIAQTAAPHAVPKIAADPADATVTVAIAHSFKPTFLVALYKSPLGLNVKSTAKALGSANICVIGLKTSGDDVIRLDNEAALSGDRCAVYVNSTAPKALVAKGSSVLSAAQTCSAGGYDGAGANFSPAPATDCPPREDPLAARTPPAPPGGCDYTDKKVKDFTGNLAPGVYCNGLKIEGASDVTFAPGIYYIKDGKLEIKQESRVAGDDVGFFFYGDNAEMMIDGEADVALTGPLAGEMAGVLIWRDIAATGAKRFVVKSPNVSTLVGTIYLPNGEFSGEIDSAGDIAGASAYTAIIAETIKLKKKSNLVLNSNYAATDVPVPAGIENSGGSVYLRE